MLGEKSCTFWLWWRACWFCISPCIISVGTTARRDIHTEAEGVVSEMWLFCCFNQNRVRNGPVNSHGISVHTLLWMIKQEELVSCR